MGYIRTLFHIIQIFWTIHKYGKKHEIPTHIHCLPWRKPFGIFVFIKCGMEAKLFKGSWSYLQVLSTCLFSPLGEPPVIATVTPKLTFSPSNPHPLSSVAEESCLMSGLSHVLQALPISARPPNASCQLFLLRFSFSVATCPFLQPTQAW